MTRLQKQSDIGMKQTVSKNVGANVDGVWDPNQKSDIASSLISPIVIW